MIELFLFALGCCVGGLVMNLCHIIKLRKRIDVELEGVCLNFKLDDSSCRCRNFEPVRPDYDAE